MSRVRCLTALAIISLLAIVQTAAAQFPRLSQLQPPPAPQAAEANGPSCVIYKLTDLGPELGRWVADRLPSIIEPNSWAAVGGVGTINYYDAGKILIVNQTAEVHAQVDAFLKNLSKTVTKENDKEPANNLRAALERHTLAPVQHLAPTVVQSAEPIQPATPSYPVPPQAKQPKHLFHFIIRYEGEGIIDDNVAKYLKTMYIDQYDTDPSIRKQQLLNNSSSCTDDPRQTPAATAPAFGTTNCPPMPSAQPLDPCGRPLWESIIDPATGKQVYTVAPRHLIGSSVPHGIVPTHCVPVPPAPQSFTPVGYTSLPTGVSISLQPTLPAGHPSFGTQPTRTNVLYMPPAD